VANAGQLVEGAVLRNGSSVVLRIPSHHMRRAGVGSKSEQPSEGRLQERSDAWFGLDTERQGTRLYSRIG